MSAALEKLGAVSTEGGPLLISDFEAAHAWTGIDGASGDYRRLVERLDASPGQAGAAVELRGRQAVVWDMPTGTADIWRRSMDTLVVCRTWLESGDENRGAFLASLPQENPRLLGRLTITSGWVAIVWAVEAGAEMAGVQPTDGKTLDLSVDGSGIIAAMRAGDYVCSYDEVEDHGDVARRCLITRETR